MVARILLAVSPTSPNQVYVTARNAVSEPGEGACPEHRAIRATQFIVQGRISVYFNRDVMFKNLHFFGTEYAEFDIIIW